MTATATVEFVLKNISSLLPETAFPDPLAGADTLWVTQEDAAKAQQIADAVTWRRVHVRVSKHAFTGRIYGYKASVMGIMPLICIKLNGED